MDWKAKTDETQAKPDVIWVDVVSGSEVNREHEPQRLLRVSGLAEPGDLAVTSYWLGDLAYTAIALASGVCLDSDWTAIDNEAPFDDTEAADRDWIAIQFPIPEAAALDAKALRRTMQILRELAAMDRPDGLTVEGQRAPDGSGAVMRARLAPAWPGQEEDGESAPGDIMVCEAPVAHWQGLPGLAGQSGAIPLWGWESMGSAVVSHTAHRLRKRLRESGYGLCSRVTVMYDGSGEERIRKMAWAIAATGTAGARPSRTDVTRLLERLA